MALTMNVGSTERWLRVVLGVMMIAGGLFLLRGTSVWLGYAVAGSGVVAALTGIVRWCPMCALGGRRLPDNG